MHHRLTTFALAGALVLGAAACEGVESWAALSSASTVVRVSDTGHQVQLEQPAVVIDGIMDLLP
jgi:pimeloyl-ACP methyl ester carboxylesterase